MEKYNQEKVFNRSIVSIYLYLPPSIIVVGHAMKEWITILAEELQASVWRFVIINLHAAFEIYHEHDAMPLLLVIYQFVALQGW